MTIFSATVARQWMDGAATWFVEFEIQGKRCRREVLARDADEARRIVLRAP